MLKYAVQTDDVRVTRVHTFLNLPPREWEGSLAAYSGTEQQRLAKDLEELAEWSALAAGYVGARSQDRNHTAGVRRANKLCTAIRRAIGFTFPKSEFNF